MHSPIAATALLEPIPRRPIHPKAAARCPAAFRALFRFPTRTVRNPQEVVILVTITACLMVETDSNRWRRAAPRSVPQPHVPCAPISPPMIPLAVLLEQAWARAITV